MSSRILRVLGEIQASKQLRDVFITEIEEIIEKTSLPMTKEKRQAILDELHRQRQIEIWCTEDLQSLVSVIGEEDVEQIFPFAKDIIEEALGSKS